MLDVVVHPHALKHGLSEERILEAWSRFFRKRHRKAPNSDQIVAVGVDAKGRLIQLIGVVKPFGVMIYHALTPPTENVLLELGLARR